MNEISKEKKRGIVACLNAADVQLSRLKLIHSNSKPCEDGRAKKGDFWDTSASSVVGNSKSGLEVIFCFLYRSYQIFRGHLPKIELESEYIKTVIIDNDDPIFFSKHEMMDGEEVTTKQVHNFFIVLVGKKLPYLLEMMPGAWKCTDFLKNDFSRLDIEEDKESFSQVYKLASVEEKNQKTGKGYLAFHAERKRQSTKEEIAQAIAVYSAAMQQYSLLLPEKSTVEDHDDDISF